MNSVRYRGGFLRLGKYSHIFPFFFVGRRPLTRWHLLHRQVQPLSLSCCRTFSKPHRWVGTVLGSPPSTTPGRSFVCVRGSAHRHQLSPPLLYPGLLCALFKAPFWFFFFLEIFAIVESICIFLLKLDLPKLSSEPSHTETNQPPVPVQCTFDLKLQFMACAKFCKA